MTRQEQEAIEKLRGILAEATESENSVCYVTEEDREPLEMAIKALEQEPCEDAISRQAVNILVDELARVISDERCCMSRGRSTATIMQDILDLPSVKPQELKTDVFDKIRAELHATAEMHEDGDYYLREEWIDEIIDKYKAESKK